MSSAPAGVPVADTAAPEMPATIGDVAEPTTIAFTQRRRVLRSTAAQAAGRVASLVVSLVTVAYLTRTFGSTGYGQLALIGAYTTVVTALADCGIPLVLARDLARQRLGADAVGTALRGRAALTLPIYATGVAVAVTLYGGGTLLLGVAISMVSLLPAAIASTVAAVYQARLRLSVLTTLDVVFRIGNLAAVVAVTRLGGGVIAVLVVGVAASVAQTAVSVRMAGVSRSDLASWDRHAFIALFRTALPLGLAVVLNTLYARVDAVLISLLRSVTDVGHYLLAYRLMEMALIFPGLLASAALPVYSRATADPRGLRRHAEHSLRLVTLVMLPGAALFAALAGPIVRLLAGPGFAAAADPLRWLAIATVASSCNIVLGLVIVALDGQRRALWLNIAGLLVNLALNLALIPRLGISAAAAVTAASEVFVTVGAVWILRGHLRAWLDLRFLPRLLPAAAACCGVALVLRTQPLAVSVPAALAAYLMAAVVTRQLDRADLRELRLALGRSRSVGAGETT